MSDQTDLTVLRERCDRIRLRTANVLAVDPELRYSKTEGLGWILDQDVPWLLGQVTALLQRVEALENNPRMKWLNAVLDGPYPDAAREAAPPRQEAPA